MPALRAGTAIITTGSGSSDTLILPVPSGAQINDLLLVWCYTGVAGRTWAPAGTVSWAATTPISGPANSAQLLTSSADSTVLNGGVTFRMSAVGQWGAVIAAVSAPGIPPYDPAAPGSSGIPGSGHAVDGGSLTTLVAGDLLLWFGGVSAAAGTAPGVITPPPGYAAAAGQANSSGAAEPTEGLLLATVVQPLAGPTGDAAGSDSGLAQNVGLLVAVTGLFQFGDSDLVSGFDAGEAIVVIPPGAPVRAQPGATWLAHFKPALRQTRVPPPQPAVPVLPVSDSDTGAAGDSLLVAVSSADVSVRPQAQQGLTLVASADAITLTDGKPGTGTIAKTSADVLSAHDGK